MLLSRPPPRSPVPPFDPTPLFNDADAVNSPLLPAYGSECPALEGEEQEKHRDKERVEEKEEEEEEVGDGEEEEEDIEGTPAASRTPVSTATDDVHPSECLKKPAGVDHEPAAVAARGVATVTAPSPAEVTTTEPGHHARTNNVGSDSGSVAATASVSRASSDGTQAPSPGSFRSTTDEPGTVTSSVVFSKHPKIEPAPAPSLSAPPFTRHLPIELPGVYAAAALMGVIAVAFFLRRSGLTLAFLRDVLSAVVTWPSPPSVVTWLRQGHTIVMAWVTQASTVIMTRLHRACTAGIRCLHVVARIATALLVVLFAKVSGRQALVESEVDAAAVDAGQPAHITAPAGREASSEAVEVSASHDPIGSFFFPALSKDGLISIIEAIDSESKVCTFFGFMHGSVSLRRPHRRVGPSKA